jgi:uncharacterized membrane protein
MQPLILLVTVFFLLILPLGWWTALRVALTAMFLLTASAHWGKRRDDLIRMVPAALPRPDLLVTVTGICEILRAVGLLISRVAPVAALGLTSLLIALFPVNVRATRQAIAIGGRPATPLPARAVIEIVFLTATIAVIFGAKLWPLATGFLPSGFNDETEKDTDRPMNDKVRHHLSPRLAAGTVESWIKSSFRLWKGRNLERSRTHMTREARLMSGIILITVPTIQYGGYFLLTSLMNKNSGYMENPLRQNFFRAGHAHAGVIVILSLVCQMLADSATLPISLLWFVRIAVPFAAVLISAGFFFSVLPPIATQTNGAVSLIYLGAVVLAVAVVSLGIGLVKAV